MSYKSLLKTVNPYFFLVWSVISITSGQAGTLLSAQTSKDPYEIHLQYKKIILTPASSAGGPITLNSAVISPNLQQNIHVCGSNQSDEHICAEKFFSTCGPHIKLVAGQSCYYWLKSIDSKTLVHTKKGQISLNLQDAANQLITQKIDMTYDMSLYFAGQGLTTDHKNFYNLYRFDGKELYPLGPFSTGPKVGPLFLAGTVFSGDLYLGGKFSQIEGNLTKNIAYWNSNNYVTNVCQQANYHVLCGPDSRNAEIEAMITYNDSLYIGGEYDSINEQPFSNIAKLSSSQSYAFNNMGGGLTERTGGMVLAFNVINNLLYIGGNFNAPAGLSGYNITGWNGNNWQSVGQFSSIQQSQFNVVDIQYINNKIYAGLSTNPGLSAIYQYTSGGLWQVAEPFVASTNNLDHVSSLILFNNNFYATSYYSKDTDYDNDVFTWSNEEQTWINTNVAKYKISLGKLVAFNDGEQTKIYYGNADAYQEGQGIAVFDGQNWNLLKDKNSQVLSAFLAPVIVPASSLSAAR